MPSPLPESRPALIFDAGAVLALVRGDVRLRARLREALRHGSRVVVPPAVVTQTVRGGSRDAQTNQFLKAVWVPPVDLPLARLAGTLLGVSGTVDVADAQIAAEALRSAPCALLTGDVRDMHILLGDAPGVVIVAI